MKNSLLFILMALVLSFSQCKKDPKKSDCEVKQYGILTLTNATVNTFNIYVDNQLSGQINPQSTVKINISQGNSRTVHAVQVGGSDEYFGSFNVVACSDYSDILQ